MLILIQCSTSVGVNNPPIWIDPPPHHTDHMSSLRHMLVLQSRLTFSHFDFQTQQQWDGLNPLERPSPLSVCPSVRPRSHETGATEHTIVAHVLHQSGLDLLDKHKAFVDKTSD